MGGQTGFGPVPVGEDGDDHAGLAAHVPRHPGVMVRIPGPHPDHAAGRVAHGAVSFSGPISLPIFGPFSATSVSSAPSQRS